MNEQNNNPRNSEEQDEIHDEQAEIHDEAPTDSQSSSEVETEATEGDEQDTFDRAYVEKLRAEAAEHRVKAKEAQEALDAAESRYRALAVESGASGVLKRPDALEWRDDWLGEDGTADLDAIRAAATQYANDYPHAAVVSGDVGQGYRGDAVAGVDLAGMLRQGA
ncbi:hypothetical protein M3C61_07575 [Dermacoccus abyssi]|uniref:hypothetical protein n=1 Tax=Dermacoccus abyssi TaxID=322596 RepID=UPI0021A2D977|nr:hypothetical protein [Dermacoccus abyssi]MCT1986879.1 hypothetical protein [Dermacoccus abyssi]